MFLVQVGSSRKVMIVVCSVILLVIPFGIPITNHLGFTDIDWFTYLFLCAHAGFFILAYFYMTSFFGFAFEHYFSLLDEMKGYSLRRIWNILMGGTFIFYLGFFSVLVLSWQQQAGTGEALNYPIYGRIFSERFLGPWIFWIFVIMSTILTNAVHIVILLLIGMMKYGIVETTAPLELWREWMDPFMVNFTWVLVFALPYPYSQNSFAMVLVAIILVGTAIAYSIFRFMYGRLRVKSLEGLKELEQNKVLQFETMRKVSLYKNLGIIGGWLTFILLVFKYFITSKHFLDNSIFFIVVTVLIVGRTIFEYRTVQIAESSLVEDLPVKQKEEGIEQKDLDKILVLKFSHYYILSFLEKNSPTDLKTIGKSFPNPKRNLRSAIEFLINKGWVEKLPDLERMNKKQVALTPKGLELLAKIRIYLDQTINEIENQ
ncbi:MAG: MarR family transcriptional regulator [Methanobacteriota archaeon]|nr:MAG: MarR family transcriptional regulator [Euryarchaeota archaeon]